MTPGLVAIAAYLMLQLAIGVWISRRIRSESDYLLAGRSLGYTLATFSIFATWFGSETVVGSAGNAFRDGVSLASAEPFGYGLCLVLMGLVFAGPLWRRKLTTLADLFRQRYSVPVERLAAIILIPGSILWAAAQIRSFGYVVATAAPSIPIDTAIGGGGRVHAAVHRLWRPAGRRHPRPAAGHNDCHRAGHRAGRRADATG